MNFTKKSLLDAQELLALVIADRNLLSGLDRSIATMVKALNLDRKIFACGNGGSMCDSLHFTQELTGRYRKDRPPIAAVNMGEAGHISCVGNDYGFEFIFSRQLEALGKEGDVLLAISTSGNSPNVVSAAEKAKELKITSVGLLGKDGGKLKDLVDIPIIVPHRITDRIQEIHIKLIHIFIEGIERNLYPQNYS
ncbi:MAG: SIS domain-containing protein [Bacteriovoracales bacterium]|nr:SIS domain-containing protein [Bacteriovoracales bacterium]